MVPFAQNYLTKKYLTDFIQHGHLYCETKKSGQCTTFASDMCDYMNNCNGNGVCSSMTGQCECDSGFFGADCGTKILELAADSEPIEVAVTGNRWTFVKVPRGLNHFGLEAESPDFLFDLYVKTGVDKIQDYSTFDSLIKS